MSGRWMTVYGALLAAVAAVAWLRVEAMPPPANSVRLEPGRFYAVDLSGSHPTIDLELDGDSRYELIVSSLGNAAQTFPVRLVAHPQRGVERSPIVPVEPLARRATPSLPARHDSGEIKVILGQVAAERRFFLHVTADRIDDQKGYVPVTGVLAAEGENVRIYVDRETPPADLAAGLIEDLIRLFDCEIIPRSRELVGVHTDIDGDGKLAVLVTGWLGSLRGGTTSLNGFVRCNDFQADIDPPFGNHADVIYLNSALQPGPALKTLLAHEYTHAVCFSRRLAGEGGSGRMPLEDDWLNEAIAHVAEKLHNGDWSNLDRRIAVFLAAPQNSPLVVRDYYRAGLWRDPGCRGATFLFLQFCVDRFGTHLLSDLVHGPAAGRSNVEQATKMRFAELVRHWSIALAEANIASVPLGEKMGDYDLSGPGRITWTADNEPCQFELCGTATAFVNLASAGRKGVVRVSVEAEPQARLQLTIVRRVRD